MAKAAGKSEKPNTGAALSPPRYLSRAEKSAFHRIVESKSGTNRQVLATEIDLVADYVQSRSRLAHLRYMVDLSLGHRDYGGWHKIIAANIRQLEASTKFSNRLGRQLGLFASD